MKVLRLHAAGDARLHEEPEPAAGDGELLVRVTAVGLCGSDRHWLVEGGIGDAQVERPLVLGHEFAGTVVSGPRAGERVALDPAMPCGRCAVCLAGQHNLCPDVAFAGHGATDGALRSMLAWPEHLAYRLPDNVSDPEAALLEPLGVALHALDLGHAGPGTTAAVLGCGPIGLLVIQALRAVGAETVVATDPLPHRTAAAAALGVEYAVDPDELGSVPLRDGLGVDVAFERRVKTEPSTTRSQPSAPAAASSSSASRRTTGRASSPRQARRKGLTLLLCRRMEVHGPATRDRARRDGPPRPRLADQRAPSALGLAGRVRGARRPARPQGRHRAERRRGDAVSAERYAVGVDFGTESGRAVLVSCADGREIATTVYPYRNGVIDERLPIPDGAPLEPDWALQDPEDYLRTFQEAVPALLAETGIDPAEVIGVGVDFTSCTMLPTLADGTPLCLLDDLRADPHAWVKLWKHHAAQPEADRINAVAAERGEPWLARYGGRISSEWFFSKALQILDEAPGVYDARRSA